MREEVPVDPKEIVRDGYDRVSRAYRGDAVDLADPGQARHAAWVAELLALLPPRPAVLDLGCGNGIPAARLLADAGCDVTAVDISPVQAARACANVPEARVICADATALELPDSSLDAVLSLYAIIHVPLAEQPALLRAAARWLRPGGHLLATVGHDAWTGTEESWLGVDAPMYWSHADAATYRAWLADAGLGLVWERFVPEGDGGHTLVLARRA